MISRADAERFMEVIHKHSETVALDLLLDLARALGLTVEVKIIDGTKSQSDSLGA